MLGNLGKLAPSGIAQGSLNDCWFLASATALIETPSHFNVMHVNSRDRYNPSGIYRYYFWVKDKWVAINIDDKLPVRYKYTNSKDFFLTIFSGRSAHGAWWAPLFEKAYAKLNGAYSRLEWGSSYESLRQMTNKPVLYFDHKKITDEEAFFNKIHRWARADYPMVVACCATASPNDKAPDGLSNNHAYTLLDVVIINNVKLAKIRNPWGSESYTGAWSDKDDVWTPALQKQTGHKTADDGVFYMPFKQMISKPYFKSSTLAVYQDFASYNTYAVTQTVAQKSITLTVPSDQVAYITFEVDNPRFKKFCDNEDGYFLNTFFFKGT